MPQIRMDCITCHNRISHSILPPHEAVDQAMARRQIDANIPDIRKQAVEALAAEYDSDDAAHAGIRRLMAYYSDEYPDYYAENQATVQSAVDTLLAIYDDSVFRTQKVDWNTHPDNIGHMDWPGCFRCHDGQHVNQDEEAIRLECNLCHSIPLVVEPGVIQPESHFNTHWIALHRDALDQTCQACHDIGNAGGTDNSSFCSNSACHGATWEYAGLDAPGLTAILAASRPEPAVSAPEVEPETPPAGDMTFDGVAPIFEAKCGTCHSASVASGGLVLTTYEGVMAGGADGAVIVPGDAEASLLVQVQRGEHFGKLSDEELQTVIDWINAGAAGSAPAESETAPEEEPAAGAGPTYDAAIAPVFEAKCGTCHSASVASGGLALVTYAGVMAGGADGAVIVSGDAEASLLVQVQRGEHFAKLSDDELQTVIDWIDAGALEK
jgi:cytochrome c5